jgi:hypothetical protein
MNEMTGITQRFDVDEGDDTVVFPARWINGKPVVLIRKDQFKVTQSDNMILLEYYEN